MSHTGQQTIPILTNISRSKGTQAMQKMKTSSQYLSFDIFW